MQEKGNAFLKCENPQQVADSSSDGARLDDVINTETASTATSNQKNTVGQDDLSKRKYKVLKNMSAEKLKNTKLANMDSKILTREKSKSRYYFIKKSTKMYWKKYYRYGHTKQCSLDITWHMCSDCKSKNSISIISVHEDPRFKYVLSEKLLFHCSDCNKYITSFNSSKTTNSKLSSAYEINIRSVLASLLQLVVLV